MMKMNGVQMKNSRDVNTTLEGIRVEQGQIWLDLDKRMNGRHVRVVSVADGKAKVSRTNPNSGWTSDNTTTLSVRRMHKSSTGWALFKGATP